MGIRKIWVSLASQLVFVIYLLCVLVSKYAVVFLGIVGEQINLRDVCTHWQLNGKWINHTESKYDLNYVSSSIFLELWLYSDMYLIMKHISWTPYNQSLLPQDQRHVYWITAFTLSVVANTVLGCLHPVKRAYFASVPEEHAASTSRASICKMEEANLPLRCQQHNPLPRGIRRERHTHTHRWVWDMHTCQIWQTHTHAHARSHTHTHTHTLTRAHTKLGLRHAHLPDMADTHMHVRGHTHTHTHTRAHTQLALRHAHLPDMT